VVAVRRTVLGFLFNQVVVLSSGLCVVLAALPGMLSIFLRYADSILVAMTLWLTSSISDAA